MFSLTRGYANLRFHSRFGLDIGRPPGQGRVVQAKYKYEVPRYVLKTQELPARGSCFCLYFQPKLPTTVAEACDTAGSPIAAISSATYKATFWR